MIYLSENAVSQMYIYRSGSYSESQCCDKELYRITFGTNMGPDAGEGWNKRGAQSSPVRRRMNQARIHTTVFS